MQIGTDFQVQLGRLAVLVRYVAIGVFMMLTMFSIDSHTPGWYGAWGFAVFVFLYNTLVGLIVVRNGQDAHFIEATRAVTTIFDTIALLGFLYLSGGIMSSLYPVSVLIILWLNVGAPEKTIWISTVLLALGVAAFSVGQLYGIVPQVNIIEPDMVGRAMSERHVWLTLAVWIMMAFTAASFMIFLVGRVKVFSTALEHEAENAEKLQRRFEQLVDHVPFGVLLVAPSGTIVRINPVAEKMIFEEAESRVRSFRSVPFFTHTGLDHYIQNALWGQDVEMDAFPIHGIDSKLEYVHVTARLFQSRGQIPESDYVLVTLEDVTERKQLERTSMDMHEQLIQAEKLAAVGQLAAGVAHQLNNPLTAIISSTQFMRYLVNNDKLEMDQLQEKLGFIEQNTSRIDRLGKNLLAYVRPTEQVMREVMPESVVEQCISFVEHAARKAGVSVEKEIHDPLIPFLCVEDDLEHVLVNLLSNAIHALEGQPEALLQVEVWNESVDNDSFLHLRVRDNGPGILPDVIGRIWEPFFTTKDETRGTGLGLPIVLSAVERYHGKISVDTEPGVGTTFLVSLPYGKGTAAGKGAYYLG